MLIKVAAHRFHNKILACIGGIWGKSWALRLQLPRPSLTTSMACLCALAAWEARATGWQWCMMMHCLANQLQPIFTSHKMYQNVPFSWIQLHRGRESFEQGARSTDFGLSVNAGLQEDAVSWERWSFSSWRCIDASEKEAGHLALHVYRFKHLFE